MSTSRAVTIVGAHQWKFNTRARIWESTGRPGIRIKPVVLTARGGRRRPAWVLEPTGETFRDYEAAMMAAEQFGDRHRTRTRSSRNSWL